MTRVAFASLPAYGHLYPLMPLAEAMHDAGAEVHVAVGPPFQDRLALPTRTGLVGTATMEELERETLTLFPAVREDPQNRWPAAFFGVINPRHVAPALREAWSEDRPDLVVYEMTNMAAPVVAAELGIPAVAHGLTSWATWWLALIDVATEALACEGVPDRMPWDLPAEPAAPPGFTYLDPLPDPLQTSLDIPGRTPIRPTPWSEGGSSVVPPPSGSRRIYVTLGTVVFGAVEALRAAVDGAAATGAEVVVACGPGADLSVLGDVADSVSVHEFVDQAALMPTLDLVVHHGGTGTMLAAAAHGVPQVLVPQGADQFINAATIERAGLGRGLDRDHQSPEEVKAAVAQALDDRGMREASAEVAAQIAARPGPDALAGQLLSRFA